MRFNYSQLIVLFSLLLTAAPCKADQSENPLSSEILLHRVAANDSAPALNTKSPSKFSADILSIPTDLRLDSNSHDQPSLPSGNQLISERDRPSEATRGVYVPLFLVTIKL